LLSTFFYVLLGVVGLAAAGVAVWLVVRETREGGADEEAGELAAAEGAGVPEAYPAVPDGLIPDFGNSKPAADPPAADVEALGRMLASEDTKNDGARIVIAWQAVQTARRGKISLKWLLTRGDGWGKQARDNGKKYYAATSRDARTEDLELARRVISGELQVSPQIQAAGPGGWYERGQLGGQLGRRIPPQEQDARLLEKQADWREGVYARLQGTKWYLFGRAAAQLAPELCAAARAARLSFEAARRQGSDSQAAQAELDRARAALGAVAPSLLDAVPEIPATPNPEIS
jgi:hypothetical protein